MKVLLFANTAWYLFNFRLSLATALRERSDDVVLVSPPGHHGEKLRELGFRWIPAPMERASLHPGREVTLLLWLRKLVLEEKPDLVHGFTIKCAVYGSLAVRIAALSGHSAGRVNAVSGLGYVFTNDGWKARFLRPLVRILMRIALGGRRARLILQNPDDVAMFAGRIVNVAQVRLIRGSGVDCIRFSPAPAGDGSRARLRVLLPARLLWDKGLAEFIVAARTLAQAGHDMEFLLAGEPDPGNPAAVPVSEVQRWVDEGVVSWLGHVADMSALMRTVDIVALPSYREGLPKGLIEAAACGIALVTTDVPGCREVVEDGVDGLLVPAKNPEALARAIVRLKDNGLRRQLGVAARAKALAQFDHRIVNSKTLQVYGELASQPT